MVSFLFIIFISKGKLLKEQGGNPTLRKYTREKHPRKYKKDDSIDIKKDMDIKYFD